MIDNLGVGGLTLEAAFKNLVMLFLVCMIDNLGVSGLTLEAGFKSLFGKGTKYVANINVAETTAPLILMTFA
jgi:hypothetical protein